MICLFPAERCSLAKIRQKMLFRPERFRLKKKITEVIAGGVSHDFLVFLVANLPLQFSRSPEAWLVLTHQA